MSLTLGDVERLREELTQLPAKNDAERAVTKQEAISKLAPAITRLRQRGYTWQEVAELVTRGGCAVTAATLKTAISRAKAKRGRGRASARPETRRPTGVALAENPNAEPVAPPAVCTPRRPLLGEVPADDQGARAEGGTRGTFAVREDTPDI